jgi:membrane-associated phospholipid phosphatase
MEQLANTHPSGQVTPSAEKTAGNEDRQDAGRRHLIEGILWFIGLLALGTACFIVKQHPQPFPGEVDFSRSIQALQLPGWVFSVIMFYSSLNDIPPSIAATVILVVFMLIMRWWQQGIFFALTVLLANGIDALLGDFVGRPRPTAKLIHVHTTLTFNSFPSGHTEHDTVFYGFLLYLSLMKPVREWRYHWWLLPLQIFAVSAILIIGFSRLYEGEHWITDVLGGYLSGLVWLSLAIFAYRWVTDWRARRKAQKQPVEVLAQT